MTFVLRDRDATVDGPLGGKARALAGLKGLPIPPWFVLTPAAFDLSSGQLSTAATGELAAAVAELCADGGLLAVRSSASDEDGPSHSFAGQLDSFLFVPAGDVPGKAAAVWRSGFSDRVRAYRREHELDAERPPSVLVQRMVDAESAGVAFGADPVSGRRGIAVVSAVWGLGSALVSGEADADTFHVDRVGAIVYRQIADKRTADRAAPGTDSGVRAEPIDPDMAKRPALSDEQVRAIADLARQAGRAFGRPQDIEWAIEKGRLYLLQSRPITALATRADPDGVLNLWDNSNIAESYGGITTPLTFSFARTIYEAVYRQFCKILRVPDDVLVRNDEIFPRMLGLIRGRIYYNLLNWYRLLALLPGFAFNRSFMEQMMGVKEGLPDSIAANLASSTWTARMRDGAALLGSVFALVRHHWRMSRTIREFYARLNRVLGTSRPDLDGEPLDALVGRYRDLEKQLLLRWDAPLINDFLAMIFFGVLSKLSAKWCGSGSLGSDLLTGSGEAGMISAEPAVRVKRMADLARGNAPLVHALQEGDLGAIERTMTPEFRAEYASYLDKFGDRCLEELKLESSTLFDDPLLLLRSVGALASRPAPLDTAKTASEPNRRTQAEERMHAALRWHPIRRGIFGWVLKNARGRVRDRENLRFERTRLFGRVRSLFLATGKQLHAAGMLDQPRDIFFLEVDEILGFVEGTSSTTDLRGLVAVRKAEFDRYRAEETPADRFETHGAVHQGNPYRSTAATSTSTDGDRRTGIGCCPGVLRGPVRVISDPRHATLKHGDILVAERTDPGWIMLFPSAAGLLVERGSLLSHSAIVARELGLPAVVSIAGVTSWLKDGDWVEMDGSTGVVTRIAPPEESDGK